MEFRKLFLFVLHNMSINMKRHHFWGAIKRSWLGLTIAAILFVVCLLLCFVCSNSSNAISFLVGIMASVIASIIYNISNKYYKSHSTYMWILDQTELFITYVENMQKDFLDIQLYRFKLWNTVVTIRENAHKLTYTKEFDILSNHFSAIIVAAYDDNEKNFSKALSELIIAKNQITAK